MAHYVDNQLSKECHQCLNQFCAGCDEKYKSHMWKGLFFLALFYCIIRSAIMLLVFWKYGIIEIW